LLNLAREMALVLSQPARARLSFKQRSGSHRNNVQLDLFGRNRRNIWQ